MSFVSEQRRYAQRKLGSTMVRWGIAGLAVPDPLPLVDEILFAGVITVGGGMYLHSYLPTISSGGITQPDVSSPIPTATGTLSQRGQVKKQIRSTSHYYSRRRKYDYGKKRRYRN